MKIQFDPNQQFQLDAIAAVVDLFDGQAVGAPEYSVIDVGRSGDLFPGHEQTELGVGNRLLLADERLLSNTRKIQKRNDIEVREPGAALESWWLMDAPANIERSCPHFTVEMETGTGKTYVYLRTIFELSRRYGFRKFVVVVPSVAIREGVLKNIQITAEHFRALYNNLPFGHFVYDAKKVSRLRQFATSNSLEILIINIDAFRKNFAGTEEERKSNVIYKESDKLSGRQPIEFVQATRPIVIIDEPQSVDSTDKSQEAIKALNPLCTLRYSATHRDRYNLVYNLDPVRAFQLKLVKQIIVGNARAEGVVNDAFVRVEQIDYKPAIKARLRIHRQAADGPREASVTVRQGADLFSVSGERANYQNGYEVVEINAEPGGEYIRFANGRTLRSGEEIGGMREDVWRVQIRETIKRHLEKELAIAEKKLEIKVLSLFFIDRVANYRDYDEQGRPVKGKFAESFEEELAAFARSERYAGLESLEHAVESLHNGYFSQDQKGVLKDTRGNTLADDDTYALIMRDKERLLSNEEPLRFIFSHSALREGWDNPNVFQICTLNESRSTLRKRQEIGRGLRLPVDQSGSRVFDDSMNRLFVMANESYEDFARTLQTEYEEECGVTFGKVPLSAIAKLERVIDDRVEPIGHDAAVEIRSALVEQGMIQEDGRLLTRFDPRAAGFRIDLPEEYRPLVSAVVDLLASYQIERFIRRERDEGENRLKKEVVLTSEFSALWDRIKGKTTYRVEFETDTLVRNAVSAIGRMETIEEPRIRITAGKIMVTQGGVGAAPISIGEERIMLRDRPVPDILAYLQNETELTRSTLVRVLRESGRLDEFFNDPQRFMDSVAGVLKNELHRLLVDGVKYDRVAGAGPDAAWEMLLFKNSELINYLTALQVNKSIYEYVAYDSEIERDFAKQLDDREDIQLFVKLPVWFRVETPVGEYNPDWAIMKNNGETVYLVRETKGTRDFLKLRNAEADKIRCGQKHFEALGVDFKVAVTAVEV